MRDSILPVPELPGRGLLCLAFLLPVLAATGHGGPPLDLLAAAAQAQGPVGNKDLQLLQDRIERSRTLPKERRLDLFRDLVARQTKEARKASLALLTEEKQAEIRVLLLRHVAALPEVGRLMLTELEGGEPACREAAAAYFLERRGREGLELLLALYDEKTSPPIRVAILRSLGRALGAKTEKAFAERFARLDEVHRAQVLRVLRGKRSRLLSGVRRDCLTSKRDDLRGEALLQLIQEGDREALALLPKLARSQSSIVLAEHLMDALFLHAGPEDLVLAAAMMKRSPGLRARLHTWLPRLCKEPSVRTWATGSGAQSPKASVRRLALDLLIGIPGEDSTRALFQIARDKKRDLRWSALEELSRRGDKRILPDLWKLLDKGNAEERYGSLAALDRMLGDDVDYLNRLLALTRKGNSALRFLALDLASRHGLRDLLELLPGLLASADWRLRSQGYMVASRVRDAKSIPLLIQSMKKESGRTEFECGRALQSLTRYYCRTAQDWERWWAKNSEGFVLPPPAPLQQTEEQKKNEKGRTTAEFYGIPVHSHRVVYVLDVSGSMNKQFGTGSTRIQVARESLKTALKKTDKRSLVNIIFFDSVVRSYAKKSVPIGRKGELDKLLAYVDKAKPLGGTNLHGALVAALKDPRVDTIFLLSDGDPSTGDITDIQALGNDILRRNRARRVRIHCIAVGLESPLLRRLSDATDGRYVKY